MFAEEKLRFFYVNRFLERNLKSATKHAFLLIRSACVFFSNERLYCVVVLKVIEIG